MGNAHMSENIGVKKEVKWYVTSFLVGAATSVATIMLSLRFYVSIKHPYFIFLITLFVAQALMLFIRNKGSGKASLVGNLLTFLGQAAMFIVGGAGAFYCLMAIYPPNMG